MPVYDTQQLLADLQLRTERSLDKAVQEFQMLPADRMLFTTHPEKWSAAQCLEHLNSYGHYYLPAIEKAIGKVSASSSQKHYKSSWLGNYFYEMMLPATDNKKMKKMRSPKDHRPPQQLDSDAVIATFIDQQEKLLLFIEQAKKIDIAKAKVPISISRFIKLQLGDVFLFLIAHNERHLLQAERMLESSIKEQRILN